MLDLPLPEEQRGQEESVLSESLCWDEPQPKDYRPGEPVSTPRLISGAQSGQRDAGGYLERRGCPGQRRAQKGG